MTFKISPYSDQHKAFEDEVNRLTIKHNVADAEALAPKRRGPIRFMKDFKDLQTGELTTPSHEKDLAFSGIALIVDVFFGKEYNLGATYEDIFKKLEDNMLETGSLFRKGLVFKVVGHYKPKKDSKSEESTQGANELDRLTAELMIGEALKSIERSLYINGDKAKGFNEASPFLQSNAPIAQPILEVGRALCTSLVKEREAAAFKQFYETHKKQSDSGWSSWWYKGKKEEKTPTIATTAASNP